MTSPKGLEKHNLDSSFFAFAVIGNRYYPKKWHLYLPIPDENVLKFSQFSKPLRVSSFIGSVIGLY